MKTSVLTPAFIVMGYFASAQVTPYVFPTFIKSTVIQKGGGVTTADMNYNTVSQEMLFLDNGVKTVLDGGNIDTVILQDKKFVPVGTVYYQKLTDTKIALYVQYHNKMMLHGRNPDLADQANNTLTASQGIRNNGKSSSEYELKLGEGYTLEPLNMFWLEKGKNFIKADDLKKISKVFPGKENAISAYAKNNHLDITKTEDMAKLIIFCNQP